MEMVGDDVPLAPVEVVDNGGRYAVGCKFDGDYDKTGWRDYTSSAPPSTLITAPVP
jgi:hypothetical protein